MRPLTDQDVDWVVAETSERRRSLVRHAPRFWNPAADAMQRHREFLAQLISDPDVVSLRTDHAYLIAVRRGQLWLVDDMVVTPPERWGTEGVELLGAVLGLCERIRFVVPAFESHRLDAARSVGLLPAECWWHRDIGPSEESGITEDSTLRVDGAEGRLVPAPPVYDPGGPVLLVTDVESASALRDIETLASSRGSRVSVVSQEPADAARATLLTEAGYVLTTVFFESGSPDS